MRVNLAEFRSAYLAEVDEHLSVVDAILLRLDEADGRDPSQRRDLRELMRILHTIKGLSAMVDVEPIVTIAHRMESVVRSVDLSGHPIEQPAVEALMGGSRAIATRVKALAENKVPADPPEALLSELENAVSRGGAPAEAVPAFAAELGDKIGPSERRQLADGIAAGRRAVRLDFAPSKERADAGLTITTVRERLSAISEIVKVLPLGMPRSDAAPGGLVFAFLLLTAADDATLAEMVGGTQTDVSPLVAQVTPAPVYDEDQVETSDAARPGVLRVEVARVDDAIDGLSALTTTRFRFAASVRRLTESGVDTRELALVMADHDRQLRDIRAAILRVRMVPLTALFERLPLVVRSLLKTSQKKARLEIDGGGAEVDKAVAEQLFPALVHLLRNAVDHGIETPEERLRAGKAEEGRIRIRCQTKNRQVEIRISDDGRGIDRARVLAKAGRENADDSTLLAVLCTPGLSTRAEVDTTSGRGMGMDIVRRIVVDGLGGELSLASTEDGGTTFVISVPLTIAIVDTFAVSCAGSRFVVPVSLVDEIVEVEEQSIVNGPGSGETRSKLFARRGETVPLFDLSTLLALPAVGKARQALVVRRSHNEPVAFSVDRVLGQQETVVRPLGDPLVNVIGVSGTTDLGDGRPTLVLDLIGLSSRISERAA